MVDAYLNKKYKLATTDNFDEFMKALGKINRQICTLIILAETILKMAPLFCAKFNFREVFAIQCCALEFNQKLARVIL